MDYRESSKRLIDTSISMISPPQGLNNLIFPISCGSLAVIVAWDAPPPALSTHLWCHLNLFFSFQFKYENMKIWKSSLMQLFNWNSNIRIFTEMLYQLCFLVSSIATKKSHIGDNPNIFTTFRLKYFCKNEMTIITLKKTFCP